MDRAQFEELVQRAIKSLPENIAERLHNIVIMVEDWPTQEQLEEVGLRRRQELLGLYQGIPLTRRTSGYNMVLPDRITIFQKPIELRCSSDEAIIKQVRRTVLHEIAHYFGISDSRLKDIGRY